jgi:hypothetical protein
MPHKIHIPDHLRVTDAHIHVQPWHQMLPDVLELMKGKNDWVMMERLMADPGYLESLLDEAGLARAVLINYVAPRVMGFTWEANNWIAAYVKGREKRLIACGSIHPHHCPEPAAEVRRLKELGIRLLKVHPPHQLIRADDYRRGLIAQGSIYESCEKEQLPIMVHTGTSVFPGADSTLGDPMAVDSVAVDFPKLKIILAHAGRPLHTEEALYVARRHANVYFDISGIPPKTILNYIPRLLEFSSKCLWGTDWPGPGVKNMGDNLKNFLHVVASESARKEILQDNALKIWPE